MIDLILVDEDTCVFGYEVSIQDDVPRGAKVDETSGSSNSNYNHSDKCNQRYCLTSEEW